MSIGFTGDGQSPKSQKPQKPPRQRGYKIKKVTTEHYGRKSTSYEKVPRSGYGSAFLRLFCLFLAIIVLYNVVTEAGYTGYRNAVDSLFVTTETIGSLVIAFSAAIQSVVGLAEPIVAWLADFFRTDTWRDDMMFKPENGEFEGMPNEFVGVPMMNEKRYFTVDDYEIVVVRTLKQSSAVFNNWVVDKYLVYSSNHPSFNVGDEVEEKWLIRFKLKNITNGAVLKGLKRKVVAYEFYKNTEGD